MAWYKTGSVSVLNGQTSVTGINTKFVSNTRVGDGFRGPDGEWYEIVNMASETALGIYPAYKGTSVTDNADYMIAPLQGYNKESADRLRAITDGIRSFDEEIAEAIRVAAEAKVSATDAANSATVAKTSEDNAKASESLVVSASNAAVEAATEAKNSELAAKASETTASNAATTSESAVVTTTQNAQAASQAATEASSSATDANASKVAAEYAETLATQAAASASQSATDVATAKTQIDTIYTDIQSVHTDVTNSKNEAATSATTATNAATAAEASAEEAAQAVTGKQPLNANLTSLSYLNGSADKLLIFTAPETLTLIDKSDVTTFVGQYLTVDDLEDAHPTGEVGSYAFVDAGTITDTLMYIWDSSNSKWVQSGSTGSDEMSPSRVKQLYESNPNTNAFTDADKTKLASIEDSHFRGVYPSLTALNTGVIDPKAGDYADVDIIDEKAIRYIWDVSDTEWVGGAAAEPITAQQVKQLYESNPDTNVFDDADKSKLDTLVVLTASDIKTLYESNDNTNAFTDTQRTKLAGIEEGATKNNIDSFLLNRQNHTGTQTTATISNFNQSVNTLIESNPIISHMSIISALGV